MALSKLDQLYRQVILDHSSHPHHKGLVDDASIPTIEFNNPTCGDVLQLQLVVNDNGVIEDVHFTISMASASMMSDAIIGKTVDEAVALAEDFSSLVQGETVDEEPLGDAALLAGVQKFPARIKCATLAWKALERAVENEKA